ncbi:hypothetical protein FPOAC2_06675 [Fusarium poae]|jgi:hypothetical protein
MRGTNGSSCERFSGPTGGVWYRMNIWITRANEHTRELAWALALHTAGGHATQHTSNGVTEILYDQVHSRDAAHQVRNEPIVFAHPRLSKDGHKQDLLEHRL